MSESTYDSASKKVKAILTELVGDRAHKLDGSWFPADITLIITEAISGQNASKEQVHRANQIAFNLTNWNGDAAFIVAIHLFPERFTPEEIEAGVGLFLCNVPSHVFAAARLAGHPPEEF